jgi:hypothetical protein
MSKQPKPVTFNDNDRAVASALADGSELTLAEINARTGLTLVPGHIVSMLKKHVIRVTGEREVIKEAKGSVCTYSYAHSDLGSKKAFTEPENEVLGYASQMEGYFTLAELASAMGLEKLSSGRINGLVKNGNLVKGDSREVIRPSKSVIKTYSIDQGIPSDAE